MTAVPWLDLADEPDSVFAWRNGRPLSRSEFACAAATVAAQLPDARYLINHCSSRYLFSVALAAVARRGATSLLPASAGEGAIAALNRMYAGVPVINDTVVDSWLSGAPQHPPRARLCDADHVAAIAFTSGSTGQPRACPKSWRLLAMSAWLCRQVVGGGRRFNVVATVPAQHMFGLETSICTAMAAGWALFDGPSFFPTEIAAALESVPRPRLLVSSPFHLRHLLAANIVLPEIDIVLSATAPLSADLACEIERRCQAEVHEIYGCSEGGSLATRRTAQDELFTPYPGVRFYAEGTGFAVSADHMGSAVALADQLEIATDGRVRLLGRDADMVKVAGRRASLTEIARHLLALPGVQDAAVFLPGSGDGARPAALVVAVGQTEEHIRRALAQVLDPIFVPRPLRLVAKLPRNALGKVPHSELMACLAQTHD